MSVFLFYTDVDHYLSVCEKVIQEHGEMEQTIMHCIFLGAAGVGKSSLMKQLLRMNLDLKRTSTQIAEKSVRVEVRDVATTVAQVSGLDWQVIENPSAQACGLMGQMFTKQETESEKANHLAVRETNQQVPEQRNITNVLGEACKLAPEQAQKAGTQASEHTTSKSRSFHFSNIDLFRNVLEKDGLSALKKYIHNPWTLYLTDSEANRNFKSSYQL